MSDTVVIFAVLIGVAVLVVSVLLVYGAVTLWSERARVIPFLLLLAVTGIILAYLWVLMGLQY